MVTEIPNVVTLEWEAATDWKGAGRNILENWKCSIADLYLDP